MNDRLFEESNEERIARLRRRFETGVERAESAHKKAVETVAAKAEAVDAAKQALEGLVRWIVATHMLNPSTAEAVDAAKQALEDFDRAFAEKDRELKLVDGRLRQALRVRGVDPDTGEVEGS